MSEMIVYIAQGSMGMIKDGKATPLPSGRLTQYERTLRQLEEKNAWKTEGTGAQFMGQRNAYANASAMKGNVTAVAAYEDALAYACVTGQTGGLYQKDIADATIQEGLLYSDKGFVVNEMDVKERDIYLSLKLVNQQSHIALIVNGEAGYRLLTEGDTSDRYPFASLTAREVFYSTSGFALSEGGEFLGKGPYGICKLVIATGEIEDVFSDPAFDCLKYLETPDGERYMMVRPYKNGKDNVSLKDMLMAPVRLIQAFAGFLNIFSMRYGGQALHGGGDASAKARQKGEKELFIEGNMLQADRILKENEQRGEKYPGIVPKEWRLVRLTYEGKLETVKQGVIDYALLPSGGFVYTNGKYVVTCDKMGAETVLIKDTLVTRVAVMG